MLTILLFAQIAAGGGHAPLVQVLPPENEARTVIERQLASPPRTGAAGGVTPQEADAVTAAYLASIGKTLTIEEPRIR